jgi:hypothetical protein
MPLMLAAFARTYISRRALHSLAGIPLWAWALNGQQTLFMSGQ